MSKGGIYCQFWWFIDHLQYDAPTCRSINCVIFLSLAVANPWAVSCWFRQKPAKPYDCFKQLISCDISFRHTALFYSNHKAPPNTVGKVHSHVIWRELQLNGRKISFKFMSNKQTSWQTRQDLFNESAVDQSPASKKTFQPLHFGSLTVRPWKCTFWPQKEAGSFSSHPFSVASCLLNDSGVFFTTSTTPEGALKVGAVRVSIFFPNKWVVTNC